MNQNNAAQPVLTDDEILAATLYGQSEARMIRNGRAIESALLSKLRAPVADERAAFEASYRSRFNVPAHAGLTFPDVAEAWKWWQRRAALASAPVADDRDADAAEAFQMAKDDRATFPASTVRKLWELKERYRRALASAPVAGEAHPVAWLHQCRKKPELATVTMNKREPELAAKGYRPIPLYAAPQASEAVAYLGDNVAARLDNMADSQPPGSQAQSDLYAAATIWRKHIAHRATPQDSDYEVVGEVAFSYDGEKVGAFYGDAPPIETLLYIASAQPAQKEQSE